MKRSEPLDDAAWLRRQINVDDDSSVDEDPSVDGDRDVDERVESKPIAYTETDLSDDFDLPAEPSAMDAEPDLYMGAENGAARPGRFDRKGVASVVCLAVAGVVIAVVAAMMVYGGGKPAAKSGSDPSERAVVATATAPTPVVADAAGVDRPLPYTASADCPPGSTSAQTLAGADPNNAFVCVRNLVDGQVVHIDLSKTYVITAISLTPGWVGKDSSGKSQWAQNRVVTRVQYVFNDTDRTIVVQDTGNVHGEAVQPVKHVLASKITMLILQTSRPPAENVSTPGGVMPGLLPGEGPLGGPGDAPTSTTATPEPSRGDLMPMLGHDGQTTTDPVDAKFAMSNLKVIGHEAM